MARNGRNERNAIFYLIIYSFFVQCCYKWDETDETHMKPFILTATTASAVQTNDSKELE